MLYKAVKDTVSVYIYIHLQSTLNVFNFGFDFIYFIDVRENTKGSLIRIFPFYFVIILPRLMPTDYKPRILCFVCWLI